MTIATPSGAPLLSIRDLSVTFETPSGEFTAVRNLSLELRAGETIAIVGESGSGKSTTAACINRLLAPNGRISSGEILFEGANLAHATEKEMTAIRGAGIGLVPQDPMSNLNPIQRIGNQIAEALLIHGKATRSTARGMVLELLTMVGIHEPERRFSQFPHEFSGGMRQRVLIAMGLACRPKLLIADEPTSALDVTVQRTILDQLDDLTSSLGTAVILITHDLALAAERADRVLVMYRGDVVESGLVSEILANPQHEYTQKLLGAAPSLNSRRLVDDVPVFTSERVDGAAEAHTPDDVVVVENVTKTFGIRGGLGRKATEFTAVSDSSFTIPRGSTVALVGESGSGKSTSANMVLRLETPTHGRVLFDGVDIAKLKGRELFHFRSKVQPVFQNPYGSLDPKFTVGASISEPLELHHIGTGATRQKRVAELLDQVALPQALAERLPHELSGGQRQRVAIARALALSPEVVVLDEAVSALDVVVQAQVLELLVNLQRELGLSYLFISHDLAVVRMVSHYVHVMSRGRIVESGTPNDIFSNAQQAYTRELLAAIPGTHALA